MRYINNNIIPYSTNINLAGGKKKKWCKEYVK